MKIVSGSLLYHSAHGLCRVKELLETEELGGENLRYALEPIPANRMRTRFIIPASSLRDSGFHPLLSTEEANGILRYLKDGKPAILSERKDPSAACLAREILSFSHEQKEVRDQRHRQRMRRSVNGLVGELAVVLKITLKETAQRILTSLGSPSRIHPLILSALEHAGEV